MLEIARSVAFELWNILGEHLDRRMLQGAVEEVGYKVNGFAKE